MNAFQGWPIIWAQQITLLAHSQMPLDLYLGGPGPRPMAKLQ